MKELLKHLSETLTLEECRIMIDTLMALKKMIEKEQINDINVLIKDINSIITIISLSQISIMDNEKKKKDKDSD